MKTSRNSFISKLVLFSLFFLVVVLNLNAACLVSQYNFSGNANDSKGTNHGTVYGATLVNDRFGNPNSAYNFNGGSSNYIQIPHTPFFLTNYSYSVWVKPKSLPSNGAAVIFLSVGGTGGDQNMQIENNQNNYTLGYMTGFTLTAYNVNGNLRAGVASGTLPNVNKWYHVVCTRDTNYFKVYVNGCLIATSPSTNGSLPSYGTSDQAATIGSRNNLSKFYDGVMDDIGIYSCALTPLEVSKLYNSSRTFTASKDTTVLCGNTLNNYRMNCTGGWCSYKWVDISNPNAVLGVDSFVTVNVNKSTTYKVTTNSGEFAFVKVIFKPFQKPKLGNDTSYCGAFVTNLNAADSAVNYLWSNGQTTKTIQINSPGLYFVKSTFANTCFFIDSIIIKQFPKPIISLGNDTTLCIGQAYLINSNLNQGVFKWNTGANTSAITVNNAGQYVLMYTDPNNCKDTDAINISYRPNAISLFTSSSLQVPNFNSTIKLENKASNFFKVKYFFGDGTNSDSLSPYHKFNNLGNFKVTQIAYDSLGCNDTSYIDVICYEDFKCLIPGAFSPNNDLVNDVFKPVLNGVSVNDYELIIYDRWGGIVFISKNPNEGWDGKIKGDVVPDSVFLYTINLRTNLKQFKTFSGTFTVLH